MKNGYSVRISVTCDRCDGEDITPAEPLTTVQAAEAFVRAHHNASHVHGTRSYFLHYGCRCEECVKADHDYQVDSRADRINRGRENPELIPHGFYSGYTNWGCRCEECTEAGRVTNAAYQQSLRDKINSGVS